MHRRHLLSMLGAGAVVLAALVVTGVPLARAAQYALLLACPLSMLLMTRSMGHGGTGTASSSCHDPHRATDHVDRRPGPGSRP